MLQELYIHAGAHRTGSSSFQVMLGENRARLKQEGVLPLYPGRDGARGGNLRLRLPGPAAGPRKRASMAATLRDELARHVPAPPGADPSPRALLLSEENLAGRMLHFQSGRFFPAADMRLAMLAEALASLGLARPRHLVYVIRPYDALFVSAYRKRAEDNPVGPFAEIAPRMVAMQAGWPEVVTALRERLQPQRMSVLSYARRGRSVDLLTTLLGRDIGAVEPETVINRSATDAALMALQARYHAGERLGRAAWQAVLANHAHLDAPRGFADFTSEQEAVLTARYAAHCETIAAMPGLTFLQEACA